MKVLFSCNNALTNIKNDGIAIDTINYFSKFDDNKLFNTKEELNSMTKIKFADFTLTISQLVIWDEKKELDKIQKDSVYLSVELGETVEEQLISIKTTQLTNIKIEQRYETSITIMDEGTHCDLTEWKHYYSEWKHLKKINTEQFICEKYDESDWVKFPKIDIDELKGEVKKQCGDRWYDLVKDIKSPTEYPSGVSISRYFLRVIGLNKENGQVITKIIIFETPMGC